VEFSRLILKFFIFENKKLKKVNFIEIFHKKYSTQKVFGVLGNGEKTRSSSDLGILPAFYLIKL
jgi:hypothetical protein